MILLLVRAALPAPVVVPRSMMKLFAALAVACMPKSESIADSHIRANVPDEKIRPFMKRELERYFKGQKEDRNRRI
jgi:hypothetical protein